ncbi:hypothetical protein [Paenibacillus paeoniae]|uniref:Uncharacterized protein n=1 Tax=Paenibacillus paeoniae TaxID=2292705 RepID=A0A371PIP6_9BACL|nr:hypothetical protein [Paenibacillus paeoniae]REK76014.1 hypothetical protein DX130_02820 [Paenibacillus paeoniae]
MSFFETYRKHDLDLEQLDLKQEMMVNHYRIERITRTLRDYGREIDVDFASTFEDRYKTFSGFHIKLIE